MRKASTSLRAGLVALLAAPLLAACVNDSASYQNQEKEVAVTLIRQQRWLWDKTVDAAVVVSRLPECQRRHDFGKISPQASIELWQPGPGTFILKQGNVFTLTETQTCEGWQKLDGEPPTGLGIQLGTFREEGGKLKFKPTPQAQQ